MLGRRVLIILLALILLASSQNFVLASNSGVKDSQYSIPFQGMTMSYYSQTMPILLQETGLSASGWVNLMFHDLTSSSSKLDISVNGNVTENGQQSPANIQTTTVDFPTNQDTILFLRNGGQQSLQIYAGPAGQAFQLIPGSSVNLSGTWTLHDTYNLHTALGSFTAYRYHYSISGGSTTLDFYASYDQVKQILIYGEVYATQNGLSALIEKITLLSTNVQFTTSSTTSSTPGSSSPNCVIATAAYGSALAPPVQFLREFRDQKVEKTYVGSQFMLAFNAWYYSWAPSIAKLESTNSGLRAFVRTLIAPLIGTLFVSQILFTLIAPINSEIA
ncbi:MAG TPA: CFI-box-CTERM domain-containing protein, partial [Candidatus Acidoferrum sp.]|nr:CFI-box-CTERM domain-containing protein [Candidatus Acidoferrum sp.]